MRSTIIVVVLGTLCLATGGVELGVDVGGVVGADVAVDNDADLGNENVVSHAELYANLPASDFDFSVNNEHLLIQTAKHPGGLGLGKRDITFDGLGNELVVEGENPYLNLPASDFDMSINNEHLLVQTAKHPSGLGLGKRDITFDGLGNELVVEGENPYLNLPASDFDMSINNEHLLIQTPKHPGGLGLGKRDISANVDVGGVVGADVAVDNDDDLGNENVVANPYLNIPADHISNETNYGLLFVQTALDGFKKRPRDVSASAESVESASNESSLNEKRPRDISASVESVESAESRNLSEDSVSVEEHSDPSQFWHPAEWRKAAQLYKENILEQFKNGSHATRSTRGTKTSPFSVAADDNSNIWEIYADRLHAKHNISKRQTAGTQTPASCTNPAANCANFVNSRFRTFDGTCNNVNNPVWGAVNRPFNRYLQPAYEDGFDAPRGGWNSRLQNARVISVTVHPDNTNALNRRITNMVPQFGQFLDHDMTLTPEGRSMCCAQPNSNPANCWPIAVGNDAFFSRFTQCLDFTRSTPCQAGGIRQQMNANTAFIDGSQVYGGSTTRANQLRTFSGGMLRTNANLRGFLPLGSSLGIQTQGDFVAGDDRINENPALIVMHNVWLMEHNRIATVFQRIAPTWNDERIYQETRRIVIAQIQQVTYNEYLPIILGPTAYSSNNLGVTTWSTYNSATDPTILNEFATAAYRFGHSLVAGVMNLFNAQNQVVDSYTLANEFFQSRTVTQLNGQGYDMILRGLMRQNAPEFDRFMTSSLTNFLFKPQNANFGSDLAARNIQRGRDHGLRSYNDYRVACGGSDLTNVGWSTVPANINADGWAQASRVYSRPSDIDLFTGGLIETSVSNGLSGPTFTCIKAMQFYRAKFGDRLFFTHNLPTGFTGNQLDNLVQRRLSDIICDNSQQPSAAANVFLIEDSSNPSIACGTGRPALNLNLYL